MQRETSNDSFLEYGQTYHEPIRLTHPDLIHQHQTSIRPPSPAAMYHSSIVLTVIHI